MIKFCFRGFLYSSLTALALILVQSVSVKAIILDKVEVISGLSAPVFVTAAPGDTDRLFVIERVGRIKVFDLNTQTIQTFLDITSLVDAASGGEMGLLGMAFHPNYDQNGYFYVNYTSSNSGSNKKTNIVRFTVTANPNDADESSEMTLFTVDQPFENHNAGMLAFSPIDSMLYIGLGDGGSGGDPGDRAQNPQEMLGKMLRIDVDGGTPYSVPADNPYFNNNDTLPEIWAFGLRNPWRFSFDRLTGDMYIGDVGQGEYEEIDFQPVSSSGGENYGWNIKEGSSCYINNPMCDTLGTFVEPIQEYDRNLKPTCYSITGGYVYRGCAMSELYGTYLYGDYCQQMIWSFVYDGSTLTDSTDRTSELSLSGVSVASFGEDALGELYIVSLSQGKVYRIVPDDGNDECPPLACCVGNRGNANNDAGDDVNISDITYLVNYLFGIPSGPAPICITEANANSDPGEDANISDITFLINYLFGIPSGPAPGLCPN